MNKLRFTVTAGAWVRRSIRRYLLQKGLTFFEDKGFLDSYFYIDCTQDEYDLFAKDLAPWSK